jgi:endonuclease/exonuclease/phosphatase family metal-dependent hydrolase
MIISNSKRAEQVNIVLEHIEKSPFISIVCGDFNDTPMSYTYHMLSKGRKDTFKEAGEGFSGTYSFLWPLLRIDYILVPEAYTVYEHITFKEKYSDHYPVISSISI